MTADLVLRWIVTVLFGIGIAGYLYVLVVHHNRWDSTIDHLLHLAMSLAMVEMAWRAAIDFPKVLPVVFFLLAAVWFVFAARRLSCASSGRLSHGYNAAMMTAMAWMYAVMNGSLPGQPSTSSAHIHSGSLGTEMPLTGPEPGWIAAVNWIATAGFAVATVYWFYRYFVACRANPLSRTVQPAHPGLAQLGLLCQAIIAAGIAMMFGLMM